MEWKKVSIKSFPWDTERTIQDRLFLEYGPLIDTRKDEIMEWTFDDDSARLSDIWKSFPQHNKKAIKKFLRHLWIQKKLTRQDEWDELFRYEMDIPLKQSFDDFEEEMKASDADYKQRVKNARSFLKLSKQLEKQTPKEFRQWIKGEHMLKYEIAELRSIEHIFEEISLQKGGMMLAVLKSNDSLISKMKRTKEEGLIRLWQDGKLTDLREKRDGLYIYWDDSEPVFLQKEEETDTLFIEVSFSDSSFWELLLETLQIPVDRIKKKKDVGVVGQFVFPNTFLEFPLFQDACMNDPLVSQFLFVPESKQATFKSTLWVSLTPFLKDLLGLDQEQTKHDLFFKNVHRQSGFLTQTILNTPIPETKHDLFFDLMTRIMGYFSSIRETLMTEYHEKLPSIVPAMFEKEKETLVKNKKEERPEYFLKYPRMFVKNLYSSKCQKPKQPVLLTEEEARSKPRGSVLRFPDEKIAEFEPEYYHCPSKDYPYAGLRSIPFSGENVFINYAPCCFKTPQEKNNIKAIKDLKIKNDDVEEEDEDMSIASSSKTKKDNVVTGNMLIKHIGQLGLLKHPSLTRFFMMYDPYLFYYRIGILQSSSSAIQCLLTAQGNDDTIVKIETIREQMAARPDIIRNCLQDNPGLTPEEIQRDIADPSVYFDPRRFIRALELFFNVRLIIFTKPKELNADVNILETSSLRSRVVNKPAPPFVFLFEHWGGKSDILINMPFPHCELIGYKKEKFEKDLMFQFQEKASFQILSNVHFQYDNHKRILPFDFSKREIHKLLIGQTPDPLGKIRMFHFKYNQKKFSATTNPVAVQENCPFLPFSDSVYDAQDIIPFLRLFKHWVNINIPDPDDTLVLWTVSEPQLFCRDIESWEKGNAREKKWFRRCEEFELTFRVRIPTARKNEILSFHQQKPDLCSLSNNYFLPQASLEDLVSPEIYEEKIARCLQDLTLYLFSAFLDRHQIRRFSIDPDSIIDQFYHLHIRLTPTKKYPEFTKLNTPDAFVSGDKICIPSKKLWDKLKYNLRHFMFYNSNELLSYHQHFPMLKHYYKNIQDYAINDLSHYYFYLDQLENLFKYSVESRYELQSSLLENVKQNGYWYNPEQSPFPFPCLVFKYEEEKTCVRVALAYKKNGVIPLHDELGQEETPFPESTTTHYRWVDGKWERVRGDGTEQEIFTFARENDCLLLLHSTKN